MVLRKNNFERININDKYFEFSPPTCAVTAAEQSIVEIVQASIEGHEEKTLRVDPDSNDCKVPPEKRRYSIGKLVGRNITSRVASSAENEYYC